MKCSETQSRVVKKEVSTFIARHQLLVPGERVLVALSGGADSVALLLVLHQLGYQLTALHCNFHLRGEESDRDMKFCRDLCDSLGIELIVRDFDTKAYASHHQISLEMAARDLRYQWFQSECLRLKIYKVAVGHHVNDQAETLLLNLVRGSGIKGLIGMRPQRDQIIRPLLAVTREQIVRYLAAQNQPYVTDSTNLLNDVKRNRIRLDIIPELQQLNPQVITTLSDTSRLLAQVYSIYKTSVDRILHSPGNSPLALSRESLHDEATRESIIFEWLEGKGFSSSQIAEVARCKRVGKVWESARWRLLFERESLLLKEKTEDTDFPRLSYTYVDSIEEKSPEVAYFDASKIDKDLKVRKVRKGDFFVPFGMKGRKLLSDFMTDLKLNLFQKEAQTVLTCGEDIIWVIGYRSDDRYRVTPETRRILKVKVECS